MKELSRFFVHSLDEGDGDQVDGPYKLATAIEKARKISQDFLDREEYTEVKVLEVVGYFEAEEKVVRKATVVFKEIK